MSHSHTAAALHGQNGRSHVNGTTRTVDWTGYSALFQRVTPSTAVHATRTPAVHDDRSRGGRAANIREAFLGFCQASLFSPGTTVHFDRPSEAAAAAKALAAAERFGFSRNEIQRLGCGLYSSPAALREDLRSVGFSDAEIESARITRDDAGRPRAEFSGCLVVPLTDENGQLCDFLLLTVNEQGRAFCGYRFLDGPVRSQIVAYGLQTALSRPHGRESLVLVDDVLECLLLQCRGIHSVAAIGTSGGDFSPRRWEELARLGVATVTLAFRNDERRATDVRDALVNALRARTAPEVFVAEAYPAGERSAADVLRRFGKDTCAVALATRSLAFHHKDFGAADRVRSVAAETVPHIAPEPPLSRREVVQPAAPHREAFQRHVAELAAALPAEDRSVAEQVIAAFHHAIEDNDLARAGWTIDGYVANNPYFWMSHQPLRPSVAMFSTAGHQSASVSSSAAVLDRMTKSPQTADVPLEMHDYRGRDAASAVEWITSASSRSRLAALCERIADALERQPLVGFVVACCEHTDRQVVLALATHLASRFSQGSGLSIDEVRSRLAGVEPSGGFRDRPWLADEAADRLRLWSSRLTFVTCPLNSAGVAAIEQAVEAAALKTTMGGVFFDGVPHFTWDVPARGGEAHWLRRFAAQHGCAMTIAAPAMQPDVATPHGRSQTPACWPLTQTAGGLSVLNALREWLARETAATH